MELPRMALSDKYGVDRPAAIMVRGAYKRYNPHSVVLRGLNMTVPEGTIYGLLGPSGCGKTTLLSCMVGRCQLDAGDVQVKARTKTNIGYMPQELALYKEFSIKETMTYYGRLFGMSHKQIETRTYELLKFLELPNEKSIVSRLSGGQERRVSFAVALLHDPQLLILDEPTVGVDPVLSASIWQHLLDMTANGNKTVVITTHYIEEARQAHTIGLMRDGTLLAEESPNQLLLKHNCSTLEQAFLELSKRQTRSSIMDREDENCNIEMYPVPARKPLPPLKPDSICSKMRILAQLLKNFYWMKRNIPIMCFLMILPVVQCYLFCTCIGRDPQGLKLGVVNEELKTGMSNCSNYLARGCNFSVPLSCRYLQNLKDKSYKLVDYDSLDEAKFAVKKNKVWGVLYFEDGYSESLGARIQEPDNLTERVLNISDVNIWQDMSNQYVSNLLRRDMLSRYVLFLQSVFRDCEWPVALADIPLKMEDAVYGNNNPSFGHFTAPAIISLFEFYLPMVFTVGAILMEKMGGLLERSLVAGVTVTEVLLSHIVVQYIVLSVQTALMMLVLFVFFDNPMVGSLVWTLSLLFLTGTSGMCYGFMVSVFCNTDTSATFMGLGSFFPLAMLSGMIWPLEGMHWLLRSIGWILPITLSTESFRALSARDWSITHPTVYKGFLSASGWIGVFMLVTIIVVKKNNGLRNVTK
ncbi:AAA+ ATPase domain,P-loop containing nucleoside triphosphate hydrolase,ABC transporter-like,ABC-2 [Cinara cedri]|uniref:AAA+ ATPase domain,P-loop containing nucleoside triphosphate hydrolase,ABC transporter-like,ABC-2 n=2 Tax=Cinara cedri TaxID=506608 RepID=A0A5E4MBG1_9HEMI|nr:AAA+ ATPase domain,P-loop containing nucleoside triphosphate hydrolase,ABC transporter-like,ABC-2 [Cinara cedri]